MSWSLKVDQTYLRLATYHSFQLPDLLGGPRPLREVDATDEECAAPARDLRRARPARSRPGSGAKARTTSLFQ
ncbi:hypothetical protein AB0M11_08475 [Streptomyces sp. NPDC051987]|uniref:hypothetical protein n=1 Tax=Streptomyces sp. NPDC051987 TaxID=3155808 RepID=UPI0034385DD1